MSLAPEDLTQMREGDTCTIAGLYAPDKRSRWRRAMDWLLRRPAPRPELLRFRVGAVIGENKA